MGYKFNPFTGNFDVTDSPNGVFDSIAVNGDINLDDGGSFTTTLQTITPTANRTVSLPDATGTVALVAGSSGQLLWNNAGANAGASTLTYDGSILTTSGRFINSYNAAGIASAPAKAWTGTWFTTGTATTTKPHVLIEPTGTTSTGWSTSGTGLGVNAATGFAGNLLDLQVNGSRVFRVDSMGVCNISGTATAPSLVINSNTGYIQFRNFTGPFLGSDGTNELNQRNGTNAQTSRLYNTYTDASNYERHTNSWSGNVFNIANEAAGTGTLRSIAFSANAAASTPPVTFTGTWFSGGTATTTKPHLLVEPTGTTSTAWSTSGTGLGVNAASGFAGNLLDLQVNGTSGFSVTADLVRVATGSQVAAVIRPGDNGVRPLQIGGSTYAANGMFTIETGGARVRSSSSYSWSNDAGNSSTTLDLSLLRDAAGTLAQRNGTNAQVFRVYNTYTSSTNYELGKLEWTSNVFRIGTEKGSGGGTARTVEVHTDSIARLALDTTGSVRVVTGLTVATLPGTPAVGMVARVTDATAPAVGSTVAGGGAAAALVWYNGTNWTVIGV